MSNNILNVESVTACGTDLYLVRYADGRTSKMRSEPVFNILLAGLHDLQKQLEEVNTSSVNPTNPQQEGRIIKQAVYDDFGPVSPEG